MTAEDSLGDRMKRYEAASTERRALNYVPLLVRIDGRAFHTWTRPLPNDTDVIPYNRAMRTAMVEAGRAVLTEFGGITGYAQSDECSLVFLQNDIKSQLPFDGRTQKIESVFASLFTDRFNYWSRTLLNWGQATFDCRSWSVPSKTEAANYFLWRERDATRNSISSIAQMHFPHKALQGVSTRDLVRMLEEQKSLRWDEQPDDFKRGTFFDRHGERPLPAFGRVLNREAVIFDAAEPEKLEETK